MLPSIETSSSSVTPTLAGGNDGVADPWIVPSGVAAVLSFPALPPTSSTSIAGGSSMEDKDGVAVLCLTSSGVAAVGSSRGGATLRARGEGVVADF